jgi:hypothetical protein
MKQTSLTLALLVVLAAAVIAVDRLGAQTTGQFGVPPAISVVTQAPAITTPPPSSAATGTGATVTAPASPASVQNIVEITRLVPAGTTPVTAFTVPAGVVLVVTDLVLTNTGGAATCGGAVNRAGAATTAPAASSASATTGAAVTTPLAGTVTQTDSTVTGPLCVPARTTTAVPLTTGIEFAAGQSVELVNTRDPAAPTGTTAGALGFHLRGLLVSAT